MISKLEFYIDSIVKKLLVVVVFSMLFLSVATIALRWGHISFSWIDILVRHLVFITAFLGATLASGKSRHIAIEILPKFLEASGHKRSLLFLNKIIQAATIVGTIWLFASGYQFFGVEKEYGKMTVLGLHSSTLVAIIPLGFILIFTRTFLAFLNFSESEDEQ